jgi:hypothetical protein
MLVKFSLDDFISSADDCIGNFLIKTELFVDNGCRFFQDTKGLDDGAWHYIKISPDVKVFE